MLKEYLTSIANAIRSKLGSTDKINAQNFPQKIDEVYNEGYLRGIPYGYNQGIEKGIEQGIEQGKPLGKLELLRDSEYMNAKVSGTAISVNDVNAVEHSVRCKVASKNIFDISKVKTTQNAIINNGDGSLTIKAWATTATSPNALKDYCPRLRVGDTATLSCNSTATLVDGTYTEHLDSIYLLGVNKYWKNGTSMSLTQEILDSKVYFYCSKIDDVFSDATWSNIQVELGTTATAYTPYVADVGGIEVSRYGKNLFDVNLDPHSIHYAVSLVSLNDGELTIKQNYNTAFASYNIAIPNANNLVGKTITISCDCKVGEGGNNTSVRTMWLDANGGAIAGTDILYKPYVSSTEYQHISVSGVVNAQPDESHDTLALMFYCNVSGTLSDGECYAYFKNIQLELGTTTTTYEPYIEPITYTSSADGTVDGIRSLYPSMTLLTNNNGVVINANYLRDIDTYIDNLKTNVALTGGE